MKFLPIIKIFGQNCKNRKSPLFRTLTSLRALLGLTNFYETQHMLFFFSFEQILRVARSKFEKKISSYIQ
jgi:hypothetical protein